MRKISCFVDLETNIIDMIDESQAKIGFVKGEMRLYYPLDSLNRLLDKHCDSDDAVLFFANGEPDSYYYCLKKEGNQLTYHRLNKYDYEAMYE